MKTENSRNSILLIPSKNSSKNNTVVSGNTSTDTAINGAMPDTIYDYLLSLLSDLDGVLQSAKYHPEKDSLYHSLQVFQCAQAETDDPELLAAALFHDIGKAIDYPNHAQVGADLLSGILSERVCWLIRHHLDLLISPKRCRGKYLGTSKLVDLERLRRWDLSGRQKNVDVVSASDALDTLAPYFSEIS